MALVKRKPFEIIDATTPDKWSRFLELQDERLGTKLEKPTTAKTPGAKFSGCCLAKATMKGDKGVMHKYYFMVTAAFKESDNDGSVAEFVNPEKILVNRLHSHMMNAIERTQWEAKSGRSLGQRQYTEWKLLGKLPIQRMQIVEFTAFQEIFCNGQRLRGGHYATLGNFRWEEKIGGKKNYSGFKNDQAFEFNPTPFERREILSQIAHGWGDYQCLWHTADTLKAPYPIEIDDAIKEAGVEKPTEKINLMKLKRSFQATESQRNFFFTAVCMPVKQSSPKSPVANRSGKLFTAMTIEVETGSQGEKAWAAVRGDRYLFQPTAEGEDEQIGIHIEFDRPAIEGLGIKNTNVKKTLVPMIFNAMENAKMWCVVDYLASTETTAVPKIEEKALANYPLYFNCVAIDIPDRAGIIEKISIPITAAFAKTVYAMKLQKDSRDVFAVDHPLTFGDPVYNASESLASIDEDLYHYSLSHTKLGATDIRRYWNLVKEKGWKPAEAAEEVSKYFSGKAGDAGDQVFGDSVPALEFSNLETPAILWGIRKDAKETEVIDHFGNEATLLKMYHDWSVNGVPPQLLLAGAKIHDDSTEVKESGTKKTKSGSNRLKKDIPVRD
jgi:hypothetical protein